MLLLKKKKVILWDFDGVLMNSMPVRDNGFREVLKNYPVDEVDLLMEYHSANGGLSRYVKFRYFFEIIRQESITNHEVDALAKEFSLIMKKQLISSKLLIRDSLDFVIAHKNDFEMHIVSGSDQEELRYLCEKMNIDIFFITINGSPVAKKELVNQLLSEKNYSPDDCVLIGDSINDFDAAEYNGIDFIGYNNPELLKFESYIDKFSEICV
ncbi:HAD family hydrolase [Christiangramia sediminis]|uniref:phosphoglycolate phosphatase n=1 Tax=Christiangramia sediminis TaxID=2881336 RepID=A0A9X1LHS5_9FLAO|nr:HAD-IA family hydrolase [Christiangramia sediminis]MCB7480616.1 HAD-IA family hydrolase [Christiangramia sediminis]